MSNVIPDAAHYAGVIDAIENGRLVPFFGAGANLCNRPPDYDSHKPWDSKSDYLPSGGELAEHLANKFHYPAGDKTNLLRVAQFVVANGQTGPLDEHLHKLFNRDYPVTSFHRFFASLPGKLRQNPKKYEYPYSILITTNYDTLMEDAFRDEGEDYDLLSYIREGDYRGKFLHYRSTDGRTKIIKTPNSYDDVDVTQRSVIIKIHGAVERVEARPSKYSFVITEDNYIDYLVQGHAAARLPKILVEQFLRSQFLFAGYSLSDWNMRAFYKGVKDLQTEQSNKFMSWAVQRRPDEIDQKFWDSREVKIVEHQLCGYINELEDHLFGSES